MSSSSSGYRHISRNASRLPEFGIRKIYEAAVALEKEGRDIIHLELGRPDFVTPEHIVEAAVQALHEGKVHYTSNRGLLELREAVAERTRRKLGVDFDPETEIIITVGAAEAALLSFAALLEPGDEVILPAPGYTSYMNTPAFFGATPVSVRCRAEDGFQLDLDLLRRSITPRTKAILVNSPNNPTGAVWDSSSLAGLAQICQEHDLLVVSDEVYEELAYDGVEVLSPASFPGMRERTIIINSISKTYSATGWRIGWVAGSAPLLDAIYRIHQHNTASANTFAQWGAVAALCGPQDEVERMVRAFDERRRYVYRSLVEMPGVRCAKPQGAFYAFPDISGFGLTSEDMAMYLLREAGVATVHGTAFGAEGEGHIRLSYASSMDNLKEAMGRISGALSGLGE